jgi:hypothetical protein
VPRRCCKIALASLLGLLAVAGPPQALAERRSGVELGITASVFAPDEDLVGPGGTDLAGSFGAWIGGDVVGRWGWFADAQLASLSTETFAGDADMMWGRVGGEWRASVPKRFEPFYSAGFGYMRIEFDNATDFTSNFVSAGLGQHVALGAKLRLRWEVRVDHTLARDGLRGEDVTQVQGMLGLNWGIGRGPSDRDGDGVKDHRDRCPETPASAAVDSRGCPYDRDGDGVLEGIDRCPDTPVGSAVDGRGCPADGDHDGVPDIRDACPNTIAGAAVNARGCAADRDGDGVPDALDACPDTVKGIEVDERGCFIDRDGDGVYDGLGQDKCPGTPPGVKVDVHGCPLDGDHDGVPDSLDRCPDTPAGADVDENGCPAGDD